MATPTVKVNPFFKEEQKTFVDVPSKVYIAAASFLGLVRLPVILHGSKYILTSLAILNSVFLFTMSCYVTYTLHAYNVLPITMVTIEYAFNIIFSFMTWKRVERFYKELNNFDNEMGCRPNVLSQSITNLILMMTINVFFTITYCMLTLCNLREESFYFQVIPSNLLHSLELFYYGHLLSLLVGRLRIMNYFVEIALLNGNTVKYPKIEEFRTFSSVKNTDMKKLMDMYYVLIKSYDFLVNAIKWQLLVTLIKSFITTLSFCYNLSRRLITEGFKRHTIIYVNLMIMEMISLFSPCIFGDRVHAQVRRLRELLASRLYENKLDKPSRCAARAFIALTEARDLKFSLLRMLEIDVSLPFKFIGLIVTYLIILLQFDKVINPTAPST